MGKVFILMITVFALLLLSGAYAASDEPDGPTTREMNLITWQEFSSFVPEKIETVLLPVGSIEPHGVIPSGTDNLAPQAMSREIAPRLNALIAPTLNYGITETMAAYPGAISAFILYVPSRNDRTTPESYCFWCVHKSTLTI